MARPKNSRWGAWASGDVGAATGLPDRSVRLLIDTHLLPAEAGSGRGAMRAIGEQGLMIAAIVGALAKAGIVLSPAARIVEAILAQHGSLAWVHLDPRINDSFSDWADADRWLEGDSIIEIRDGCLVFTCFAHLGELDPEVWQRQQLGRLEEKDDGTIQLVPIDSDWENPVWRGATHSLVTVTVNATMAIRRALRVAREITPE